MGADKFVLRHGFFDALGAAIVGVGDWLIDFAELAEVFEVDIHSLVGDARQRVSAEVGFGVAFEDGAGVLVELDGDCVGGFDGGYCERCAGDVGTLEVVCI